MSSPVKGEITSLIEQWRDGDRASFEDLLGHVMQNLSAIARSYLRREKPNVLVQTDLIVDDLCLALGQAKPQWTDSKEFFVFSRLLIKNLLIQYKRSRAAQIRGGRAEIISLLDAPEVPEPSTLDPETLLTIQTVLDHLEEFDPEGRKLIELRFFFGYTIPEQAKGLGWSIATVKRRWRIIRLWLAQELKSLSSTEGENDT